MIAATQNKLVQIFLNALGIFRVFHVQAQMIGIVVVAAKNRSWHRTIGLMNDRLDTVCGYDGPLRRPLDELGGNNLLRHYNHAAPRLSLLIVTPAGSVNLTISFGVRNLHMNERYVRLKRPQQDVLLSGKGTL